MHILIITPHFLPENFKCNDLAFELYERGHEVTVMTAIPDYPEGKYYSGYGLFKRRKENINGVQIHRSLIFPRGNGSSFRLGLNYLSYTIFASLKALTTGFYSKYDAIIVHETSPVLVGVPAVIIKKLQKIPLHFWVLDLWPESLSAAGGIKNKYILGIFNKITKWIYRNSDTILIGSKGYKNSINKKGNFNKKIKYFPNWVEHNSTSSKNIVVPSFPPGFNILVAGNVGEAQDFQHLLETMLLLKDTDINLNIVGDGRKLEFIKRFVEQNHLKNRVFCYGRYPLEAMPLFFHQADLLFMALKNEPVFSLTVPARLQSYMASGKPIVGMINGEGADLIKEADCGWTIPAENSEKLASMFKEISQMDKKTLETKGFNGKVFCQKNFNFSDCIDNLEDIISKS